MVGLGTTGRAPAKRVDVIGAVWHGVDSLRVPLLTLAVTWSEEGTGACGQRAGKMALCGHFDEIDDAFAVGAIFQQLVGDADAQGMLGGREYLVMDGQRFLDGIDG